MWSILIIILNILYQLCGHEQINIVIPCDIPLDGILDSMNNISLEYLMSATNLSKLPTIAS